VAPGKKLELMNGRYLFPFLMLLVAANLSGEQPPALKDPFLDQFVGDWRIERKMGSGRVAEDSLRVDWVLNHQFIRLHYGQGGASSKYEAMVFIGFNDADKIYVCHWVDVFGGAYSLLGKGKMDPLMLSIEFNFGDITNKFTFDPPTKTWTSFIRQQEKGEWKTFAEEKWTRAALTTPDSK
jgi:hypothetical protein